MMKTEDWGSPAILLSNHFADNLISFKILITICHSQGTLNANDQFD